MSSSSRSRTAVPACPPTGSRHIFERFYKADPSRHGGSSGLGLAIAAEHAALLGGTLRAVNRGGRRAADGPPAACDLIVTSRRWSGDRARPMVRARTFAAAGAQTMNRNRQSVPRRRRLVVAPPRRRAAARSGGLGNVPTSLPTPRRRSSRAAPTSPPSPSTRPPHRQPRLDPPSAAPSGSSAVHHRLRRATARSLAAPPRPRPPRHPTGRDHDRSGLLRPRRRARQRRPRPGPARRAEDRRALRRRRWTQLLAGPTSAEAGGRTITTAIPAGTEPSRPDDQGRRRDR